jgi:hypothetical protein
VLTDESTVPVLFWVCLVAAAGFAIAFKVTPSGMRLRTALLALAAVGFLVLAWAFHSPSFGTTVLIVKIPGSPTVERARLFGSRTYTFWYLHRERLSSGERTLIVNDSHIPLSLETVNYGGALAGYADSREPIPPASTYHTILSIDYVGPNDRPPSSVETQYVPFATREWLTW